MSKSAVDYLGVEIGGTKLQIVAGSERGVIERRWRAPVNRDGGASEIVDQIRKGIDEIRVDIQPNAIGVGFGGPINWKTGHVARSHQVGGWDGVELGPILARHSGLPVATDNDSNTGALAEATCGAGAGESPVFYFNLGSGVGGGLVIKGHIYHGIPPGEAEFGHLRLDRSGTILESRCSGWAVDRRLRAAAVGHPDGLLAQTVGPTPGGEARHLASAVLNGDPQARIVIDELADDLAFGLSHVIHLIHPAVIIIGGGLSLVGEPLRAAVAAALPRHLMEVFAPGPPVRLSALGEDAVPVGALLLAARIK